MFKEETIVRPWKRAALIIWSAIGIIILVGLFLYVFDQIRSILTPFIYALALVYILRPIVNFLEEKKVPRMLALLLAYLLFIIILALFLLYLVPILIQQAGEFARHLPKYVKAVQDALLDYLSRLRGLHVPPPATDLIEEALGSLKKSGLTFASRLPGATVGLVSGFVSSFLHFVLAPVIAFYALKDLPKIKAAVIGLIPPRHRDSALEIVRKVDEVVGGFIKGQALVALLVGILVYLWLLIIGVNYPLIIGTITAVLNIIPYFGPLVGGGLAVIVAGFESWQLALLAGSGIFVIQQLDGMLISPHIMSSQVEVHPVLIIFSMLVGGYLFGIMGMLLAIPVAAVAKALVYHFLVYEDHHAPAFREKPRKKKPSKT